MIDIVLAIVIGAAIGVVGFVPTFKLAGRARKMMLTNNVGSLGILLLSFLISFIVMIIAIVVCSKIAKDVLLPFVLALVLGLIVTAIVFGIKTARK